MVPSEGPPIVRRDDAGGGVPAAGPRGRLRLAVLLFGIGLLLLALGSRTLFDGEHPAGGAGPTLRFFGHAAFLITSPSGFRLLMDPCHQQLGLGPLDACAHVVTMSHPHPDHSSYHPSNRTAILLPGVQVDEARCRAHLAPVDGTFYDFEIRNFPSLHDTKAHADLGPNAIFRVRVGGITIVHLGDLGRHPDERTLAELGEVDVLLVPVGGSFTIDGQEATRLVERLTPRIVIPMHYRLPGIGVELEPVERFLDSKSAVRRLDGPELTIRKNTLPAATSIIVLEPDRKVTRK